MQSFGDLLENKNFNQQDVLDSVRGSCAGGLKSCNSRPIEYVTIASEGNSVDFGDLSADRNDVQMGFFFNSRNMGR